MTRLVNIVFLFLCIALLGQKSVAKEIQFLEPVIVDQSFSDLSEKQHSPNLSLDNNGYLLTYHIDGASGKNLKTIRLISEPQFLTVAEYLLFDSTHDPLLPTALRLKDQNILFYYEQLLDEQLNDTLFQQRLTIYNNEIPTDDEIYNSHDFFLTEKAYQEQSQFMQVTNRIYCEVVKKELTDIRSNRWELSLRSMDVETSDLYPPNLHFSANGKTAILPYGDSLLVIKSWVYCTEYENLSCSNWATGYKAYVIFENKIKSIYGLSSKDITNADKLPDDIFVRIINNEYLFALRQSNQLMKINFPYMNFVEILDLSQYTTVSYKKIIPIQTVDYCVLALLDYDHNGTIMRFDTSLQFIDSVTIPFEGEVTEVSDFVYDASKDMLSYAYATKLFENSESSRIFLQSVLFDKELILNPPEELPENFTLAQNYPNPFNPTTTINYSIPQNGHATIDIYNMLGQKVTTLFDDNQVAGEHEVNWDATDQSSGMYLIKVSYENQAKSIKTMLLK